MANRGLVDWLILPLKWLERSKGWKRRGLVFLYLLILSVVAVLGYRELHLWRLPNIREPFDEARYGTVNVADSDNAMPLYLKAERLLAEEGDETQRQLFRYWGKLDVDWDKLDPEVRRWVEEKRQVLTPWLEAADRRDSLLAQPNQLEYATNLRSLTSIQMMAKLARVEVSRRMQAGDASGAWLYDRAILRSSRHVGLHGGLMQRFVGTTILGGTTAAVDEWIDHPATTPAMLRRAIRDVEACQAMTPPLSEMVRVEYFAVKNILSNHQIWRNYGMTGPSDVGNWYVHLPRYLEIRDFLNHEPERSQRVHRLVTAGLLAQVDRPRWARPRIHSNKYSIYEIDNQTPRAVASITPEALAGWAASSAFGTISEDLTFLLSKLEAEAGIFDNLRLRMAERAYQMEHGKPARSYGDLLGAYLNELPEGIEPAELLNVTPVSR